MSKRRVDRIAERIAREERRRLMRELGATEAQIEEAYRRAAERIRARLRDVNTRTLTREQIQALTRDILDDAQRDVQASIEATIRGTGDHAAAASAAEAQAVFTGAEATVAASLLTNRERLQAAAEQIRGTVSVDGVSLSSRIRRNHRVIEREMAGTMQRSIRAGESITRRAERLIDVDDLRVGIGRHVDDLADAARAARATANPSAYRSRINRLGSSAAPEYSLRAATEQLVNELRTAAPEEIDGIVERFVLEKARYQARMIARTETIAAYRRAFVAEQENKPHVVGIRWTLSGSHPRPDVCDILAGQDLYGMGPGGYPKDAVPEHPHPLCTCGISSIVDTKFIRRELAAERGEPEPPRDWESGERVTGAEWLARQPEATQRRLLGPTRLRVFQSEPNRVIARDGTPRPVHEVLGRAPQQRAANTVHVARPVVQADRAVQVQPFPVLD
jgi:hypothetical protein